MKKALFTIISLMMSMAHARVADFNKVITENIEQEKVAHLEVSDKVGPEKAQQEKLPNTLYIAGEKSEYTSAPAKKQFLRYKKELKTFKPSAKDQTDRLAQEIKSTESEF